ncbi:interleukin-12 subunit beta [Parambassis ranga]|uniref:Interleukin-12 subunit beta n=1 Tax=Parambassis ranga TaxID=210632 RepID=A0A6P7JKX1_9TELE|nr:interleukin-12 subunit beta-like [Parambassis ranga]
MMHAYLTLLIALWAVLGHASSHNIRTLMDNVVVLRVPEVMGSKVNVPLTCGDAYESQPVFWKKNGMMLESPLEGNQVTVEVEEMNGGNYTCHLGPSGEYLNHTMILVQLDPDNRTVILEEKSPSEGYIHCSAPNYKGSFHCTWTREMSRSHAVVLLVKAQRYMEMIPCELDADGSGVHCQDANCPYKEEQHRIFLTVYIHSHARLEGYTKSFFLREIVRPAKLPNLHVSDGTVFSWDYPTSWEKPCTFFGLHFEVKVVHSEDSCNNERPIMHNTTDKTMYDVTVRKKKYVFCVRAQDKYTSGPWSHWSQCTVNKGSVMC